MSEGCENNLPPSSFTINGKSYRTCNTCRLQNKEVYHRKLHADDDQLTIEFPDFYDFLASSFNNMEGNEDQENKENLEFKFSCIVNIDTLKDKGDFKEQASQIISIIADVDEYTWV